MADESSEHDDPSNASSYQESPGFAKYVSLGKRGAARVSTVQSHLESVEEAAKWYSQNQPVYASLAGVVRTTLENLINDRHIQYLSVTARAKSHDSFKNKLERKEYLNFRTDIHDLAGVRVIAYVQSEADKVADLVQSVFNAHVEDSLDKSTELGVDRMGYRSLHFVCDLGEDRFRLPEFERYRKLVFEVQVRTVLQHAWADIEHDRTYKSGSVLPTEFQRRFSIAAGQLEAVDREFDALATEIDAYKVSVGEQTKSGDLDIELNTASLKQYLLSDRFPLSRYMSQDALVYNIDSVTEELLGFGILNLDQLNGLFSKDFLEAYQRHQVHGEHYALGALRDAMMYQNIERYFTNAWKHHWQGIDNEALSMLENKYGSKYMSQLIDEYGLDIIDF